MSPDALALVEQVRALGVRIWRDGDAIALSPRGVVPEPLKVQLRGRKREVLALLTTQPSPAPAAAPPAQTGDLRAAYWLLFEMIVTEADGHRVDPVQAAGLHAEVVRLVDELGLTMADAIYADALRQFRAERGRCGLCGGAPHPPEDEP